MLEAAKDAKRFVAGRGRNELLEDRQLLYALVKCVEIMGEAAIKLSASTKLQAPGIPWPKVINMRHRLVHAYFDIDVDFVWSTVAEDLPPLMDILELWLAREPMPNLDLPPGQG